MFSFASCLPIVSGSVTNSFYSLVLGGYLFPCACSNLTPEKEIKRNERAQLLP